MRGATESTWRALLAFDISTHAPLAGRDCITDTARSRRRYFNPRAPCGARLTRRDGSTQRPLFQPTRPLRGATPTYLFKPSAMAISTHAPLAGRDKRDNEARNRLRISTHAPLAGRDASGVCVGRGYAISTHAPLAGRDQIRVRVDLRSERFQPTRPLRGATKLDGKIARVEVISTHAPLAGRDVDFLGFHTYLTISTHAPLAGRDITVGKWVRLLYISTHAPLAGRDVNRRLGVPAVEQFQPTRPLRGATRSELARCPLQAISTHAPLAGRDQGRFASR